MVGCIHKWPWSWLVPLQIYFWLSLKGCDKWRRFLKTGRKQIPPSLTSETSHGSGCMEVNHSFLSDLYRKQSPVWKGRVQKKGRSGDPEHFSIWNRFWCTRVQYKYYILYTFSTFQLFSMQRNLPEVEENDFQGLHLHYKEQPSSHPHVKTHIAF